MKSDDSTIAPGGPGIPARWSSSAKDGIGKALNASSNVSFTLSHGVLNEIYYPREDIACTRDMEFVITDGKEFSSEEKRHTSHEIQMLEKGVPAYHIINGCLGGNYSIEKTIIADPLRDVVLQKVRFQALKGNVEDYQLFAILTPHINNSGGGNTAWVDEYKGVPMIFAQKDAHTVAFACSYDWKKRSVGFVGQSDGWQDLREHKQMFWEYQYAENGNLAMTGQVDMDRVEDTFLLAIGFGIDKDEAGLRVWSSLINGYDEAERFYIQEWKEWQKSLKQYNYSNTSAGKFFRESAAVLRMHKAKRFPGAIVASMSIPWGQAKGDHDIGGYHLVWARDLVESSGGLLAMDEKVDTQSILHYLAATQEADGSWPQNMWLSGKAHWTGIQLDEIALPVLLIDFFRTRKLLQPMFLKRYWKVVEKAIGYLLRNGPYTQQDRWEQTAGYSTFTLATEVAAMLAAADFAKKNNFPHLAKYCYETADYWNDNIERWTYVTGTPLAAEAGVEGYYIRINPFKDRSAEELHDRYLHLSDHNDDEGWIAVNELVSPDALALVRFGLRAADDPRILNTIKVIDRLLKVDTPGGPCWYRYNQDGYGEKSDGSAYDGTGIGRLWPLLTGERAHYEIAAGHLAKARSLVKAMESFANYGLIPEQIWDTEDIPEKELFFGKHSGSAMPLVWAHAEYIKLCASLKLKKVCDMPEHGRVRYIENKTVSKFELWRFEQPCGYISRGKKLRIELPAGATIRWTRDNWATFEDTDTVDTHVGWHIADLPKATKRNDFQFTFYWKEADRWEGENFTVKTK